MNNLSKALGLIEVTSYVAVIEAADAALKAANVTVAGITKIGSGIVTLQILGEIAAIHAAVEAGADAALRLGKLRVSHVIARADDSLFDTVIKTKDFVKDSNSREEQRKKELEENKEIEQKKELEEKKEIKQDEAEKEEQEKIVVQMILPNKEVSYEQLKKKSNQELRKQLLYADKNTTESELKYLKKEELIQKILADTKNID